MIGLTWDGRDGVWVGWHEGTAYSAVVGKTKDGLFRLVMLSGGRPACGFGSDCHYASLMTAFATAEAWITNRLRFERMGGC